jgi:hypothetical protein
MANQSPPRDLPPRDAADSASDPPQRHCVELCPICRTADLLRAAGGAPELRGQLDDVGREALLTMRSLIDHYIDRLDTDPGGAGRVEDIPID